MNCPDCNGTGKYVGLTVVENCSKCGGIGCFENYQAEKRVHRIRTDGPMVINVRDLMQRGEITIFDEIVNMESGDELQLRYTIEN